MTDAGHLPRDPTRPSESRAAALPLEPHEGIAPVAVRGDRQVASDLVSGPLPRAVARLAVPAVASTLLMTLFASLDAFWVGTRIGATGLAAVATSIFWIWMIIAVAEMVSIGLTAFAARRHGEGRGDLAAAASGSALVFSLVFGCVIAVAGLLALPRLFAVMHMPADVTALGTRYLGTFLLGSPLVFGFFAIDATFRASGDARTPFLLLLASVGLTIFLDPALILGWGPLPELGIAGAAVGTVATRAVAFVLGLRLAMRRGLLRFGPFQGAAIRTICRIGLPTATTGVVFSLIYVFVTRSATPFGTPALAALGIGHRVESWLYMVGIGGGAAAAAIVGQSLGAGMPGRAERAGWQTMLYASVPALALCVLELTIPARLASVFTHDAAVIVEAARYLRICAVSELVLCAEVVLEGALGGAGETLPPMLSSTTLTLARIPLAAWAAPRWGTSGIWWTISLTAILRGVAMMGLWKRGGWKKRAV